MATFITVEQEGSPLLRRNKEQTQANRLSKVEGDEQRRTGQQARDARQQQLRQQGLDASGNAFGDGRRRRFRADEPAASFRQEQTGMARAWYNYFNSAIEQPVWRVFCGDGSKSLSGTREFQSGFARFFLPAGNPYGIFVVLTRTTPGFPFDGTPLNRAYVCGPDKIREVNIPTPLANILEVLNPPSGRFVDIESLYIEGVNMSPLPPRQLELTTTGRYDPATGWAEPFGARQWSPRVFELLNILKPYTNSSVFKQYSQDYPITYDYTEGLYNSFQSSDKTWYYAKWLGDPFSVTEDPALYQRLPRLTLKQKVWPPANPDFPYRINIEGVAEINAESIVAWDWDDPAYCRRMLTLLGFSSADFKP